VQSFEEGYGMPQFDEITRDGYAGGACSNHRHILSGRWRKLGEWQLLFKERVVAGKALQASNGNGLEFFPQDAGQFALALMGADPAADRGQGGAGAQDAGRIKMLSLGNFLDKSGDIDFSRAVGDTLGFFARQAAMRFFNGGFPIPTQGNFIEVTDTFSGILVGHGMARYGATLGNGEGF
jgi:hypothetical protein